MRKSYRSPSRARTTSKLSHTGAQWQRQAAWLSVHCEVPAESALSKASRLVPGAWAAHGFWNGQAGTRGLWSGMARPGCRKGRWGDPQCRMPADRMPGPRHRPPLLLTRNKAASADPVGMPAVIVSGAKSNGGGGVSHKSCCNPVLGGENQTGHLKDRCCSQGGVTGAHLPPPRERLASLPRRKQPICYILITTRNHSFSIPLRIESAFPN